jgi:protein TonB
VAAAPEPTAITAPAPPAPVVAPPPPVPPAPEEVTLSHETLAAMYLRNPKPGYPGASKRMGEQGTVYLRVFVTAAGNPERVELKTSSGFQRLDQSAREAVARWKFAPAKRGNQDVDAWVVVPIKFSLKG